MSALIYLTIYTAKDGDASFYSIRLVTALIFSFSGSLKFCFWWYVRKKLSKKLL